jgi:tetratricopeptide (TPR) repeat protein
MTLTDLLARRGAHAATVAYIFCFATLALPHAAEAAKKAGAQAAGPGAQGPGAGGGAQAEQKAQAAAAARKAYDAGLKDFAAGRNPSAIEQLSAAVQSGSLAPSEMAKALLTRGLAYKKSNKPGQAISDLTSAVWIKNGLSPAEQKSAMAERAEAYQMAGLADTGSTPDKRAIGAAAPAAAAAANVVANPAPGPNAGSAGLSAGAIAEAAGEQKSSAVAAPAQSSGGNDVTLQSAASSGVASEQKPASSGIGGFFGWGQSSGPASSQASNQPASEPQPQSTGSSFTQTVGAIPGNVGGFFSNMFGGGSSASATPAPESSPVSTGSTAVAAPETSSWSSATTMPSTSRHASIRAEKASYAPEAAPQAATFSKGKYKIHLAAMRSRAEAEAMAQKLIAEHAQDLGNRAPVIDETVIGSMGTFYRVRLGGYASMAEPQALCGKLRSSGLDCLVVTN